MYLSEMSVLFPDNPGTSLGDAKFSNFTRRIPQESPEWIMNIFPNNSFLDGETHANIKGFCRDVLLYELPVLGLRYWDIAILIPNLIFSLFLLLKARHVLKKITGSRSPVFRAFFILVYLTTFMNIVRCIVSMSISATNPIGELVDKILWIALKFFYMTSELSVLTFALLFGHLDSSTSIRRALMATLLISLVHTAIQSVLEFKVIHQSIADGFFDLHSHGGVLFWMLTAAAFALVYLFVLCLPLTCVRRYVTLPSKWSFYLYCILLSFLNVLQSFGAVLLFFQASDGMCFIDFSTYLYFCFYTPIVYMTFLRRSLKHPNSNSGNSLFSYRKQRDEHGSGDLPDSYYPRFSGLTSPSYDDLFDCSPRFGAVSFLDAPLMLFAGEPAESTVTTRTDSNEWEARYSGQWDATLETRHLKGLGADGSLVFEDDPYPRFQR
ncbi:hypothetical protein KIN20_026310 [Parelaphostrongylus tenuis]|uniref:Transmembrane protein adipocyte-associated 1 homolog n=1 Tax=Parelaphostrongylus tenuis TaxID=148309 RepID=A0AAD5N0H2_PARTN|nr:hypothetical protein KIN20_026310 [Parelaphostrongylus tenuis]